MASHPLLDFLDELMAPPPPPTLFQQVRAVSFWAMFMLTAIFAITCGTVGFAFIARALVRWVIG